MTALERHSGKNDAQRLAEAERILSDHINGTPISQMMEKYGVSKATIYRRIEAAVDARVAPTVDRYREMMNAAYQEQMEMALKHKAAALILIEQATTLADPKALTAGMLEHARSFDMIARTREAQRKLNGLDLPAKVDVSMTVTTPLDTEIAGLVGRLDDRADAPAS